MTSIAAAAAPAVADPLSEEAGKIGGCVASKMSDEARKACLLDPRTYQVFRFRDKSILYDVRTGIIAAVTDPFTYDLLHLARHRTPAGVVEELGRKYEDIDEELVLSAVAEFRKQGFFFYEHRDRKIAEKIRALLVDHRPKRIQLFVAQACNLACIYCYAEENGSNARNRLMTFERAREAIDHLIRRSGRRRNLTIQFFGGEPLLNYKLIKQIVEYTKELEKTTSKRFSYQISTNGTKLTEEIQDFIVEHDMGTLVSLDGDEKTHNAQRPLRSGGNSYHLVVDNARSLNRKFRAKGARTLKVRANITNRRNANPFEISDHLESLGFTYIGISGIFPRPGQPNDLSFTPEENLEWRAKSDEHLMEWLKAVDEGRKPESRWGHSQIVKALQGLVSRKELGMIRCGVGRNTNAVDTDGNIFPCHRYVGMDNYILGNTNEGIDKSKERAYYDALIRNSLEWCSKCWARGQCGGICPWELSRDDGSIGHPPEEGCEHIRYGLARSMYIYVCLAERHPEYLKELVGNQSRILLGEKQFTEEDADGDAEGQDGSFEAIEEAAN